MISRQREDTTSVQHEAELSSAGACVSERGANWIYEKEGSPRHCPPAVNPRAAREMCAYSVVVVVVVHHVDPGVHAVDEVPANVAHDEVSARYCKPK